MALKRIDKFMNSEELKSDVENIKSEQSKTNGTNGHSKDNGADAAGAADKVDNGVEIIDASFQWESNQVPLVLPSSYLRLLWTLESKINLTK